jgi:hypothetical protein
MRESNDGLSEGDANEEADADVDAADVFACGWDDECPAATAIRRREMMDYYIKQA